MPPLPDSLRDGAPAKGSASSSGVRRRTHAPTRDRVGAVVLHEALDGIVSVQVARLAIAEALAASGQPFPETLEELGAFARGPLARQLCAAGLDAEAEEIAARIGRLAPCVESPTADDEATEEDEPTERLRRVSLRPVAQSQRDRVRVVVLATSGTLADALAASRHAGRLALLRVTTEAALVGALCATGPLVVVIDAASPVDEPRLVDALRSRSARQSVLITDADQPCGRRIVRELTRAGVAAFGVAEGRSADSIAEILVRQQA